MKLKSFRPIQKTEEREMPPWADRVLAPVNSQLRDITEALSQRLSAEDNLNVEYRVLRVRSGQPLEFTVQRVRGKPREIRFVGLEDALPYYVQVLEARPLNLQRCRITMVFNPSPDFSGVAPTEALKVRLRIEGA